MKKEISVNFNWVDDECASITCPYCKEHLTINIYEDMANKCRCGKKFILQQRNWVEEIIEGRIAPD